MDREIEYKWKKILGEKERCVYYIKGGFCSKKIEELFAFHGPYGEYSCGGVCKDYREKNGNGNEKSTETGKT